MRVNLFKSAFFTWIITISFVGACAVPPTPTITTPNSTSLFGIKNGQNTAPLLPKSVYVEVGEPESEPDPNLAKHNYSNLPNFHILAYPDKYTQCSGRDPGGCTESHFTNFSASASWPPLSDRGRTLPSSASFSNGGTPDNRAFSSIIFEYGKDDDGKKIAISARFAFSALKNNGEWDALPRIRRSIQYGIDFVSSDGINFTQEDSSYNSSHLGFEYFAEPVEPRDEWENNPLACFVSGGAGGALVVNNATLTLVPGSPNGTATLTASSNGTVNTQRGSAYWCNDSTDKGSASSNINLSYSIPFYDVIPPEIDVKPEKAKIVPNSATEGDQSTSVDLLIQSDITEQYQLEAKGPDCDGNVKLVKGVAGSGLNLVSDVMDFGGGNLADGSYDLIGKLTRDGVNATDTKTIEVDHIVEVTPKEQTIEQGESAKFNIKGSQCSWTLDIAGCQTISGSGSETSWNGSCPGTGPAEGTFVATLKQGNKTDTAKVNVIQPGGPGPTTPPGPGETSPPGPGPTTPPGPGETSPPGPGPTTPPGPGETSPPGPGPTTPPGPGNTPTPPPPTPTPTPTPKAPKTVCLEKNQDRDSDIEALWRWYPGSEEIGDQEECYLPPFKIDIEHAVQTGRPECDLKDNTPKTDEDGEQIPTDREKCENDPIMFAPKDRNGYYDEVKLSVDAEALAKDWQIEIEADGLSTLEDDDFGGSGSKTIRWDGFVQGVCVDDGNHVATLYDKHGLYVDETYMRVDNTPPKIFQGSTFNTTGGAGNPPVYSTAAQINFYDDMGGISKQTLNLQADVEGVGPIFLSSQNVNRITPSLLQAKFTFPVNLGNRYVHLVFQDVFKNVASVNANN